MARKRTGTIADEQTTTTASDNGSVEHVIIHKLVVPDNDDLVIQLIEELQAVDLHAPLAKINETTMSDNNGGRIEL